MIFEIQFYSKDAGSTASKYLVVCIHVSYDYQYRKQILESTQKIKGYGSSKQDLGSSFMTADLEDKELEQMMTLTQEYVGVVTAAMEKDLGARYM